MESRVIDTPGLFPSSSDHQKNKAILPSVKRIIKRTTRPDIVELLYVTIDNKALPNYSRMIRSKSSCCLSNT